MSDCVEEAIRTNGAPPQIAATWHSMSDFMKDKIRKEFQKKQAATPNSDELPSPKDIMQQLLESMLTCYNDCRVQDKKQKCIMLMQSGKFEEADSTMNLMNYPLLKLNSMDSDNLDVYFEIFVRSNNRCFHDPTLSKQLSSLSLPMCIMFKNKVVERINKRKLEETAFSSFRLLNDAIIVVNSMLSNVEDLSESDREILTSLSKLDVFVNPSSENIRLDIGSKCSPFLDPTVEEKQLYSKLTSIKHTDNVIHQISSTDENPPSSSTSNVKSAAASWMCPPEDKKQVGVLVRTVNTDVKAMASKYERLSEFPSFCLSSDSSLSSSAVTLSDGGPAASIQAFDSVALDGDAQLSLNEKTVTLQKKIKTTNYVKNKKIIIDRDCNEDSVNPNEEHGSDLEGNLAAAESENGGISNRIKLIILFIVTFLFIITILYDYEGNHS